MIFPGEMRTKNLFQMVRVVGLPFYRWYATPCHWLRKPITLVHTHHLFDWVILSHRTWDIMTRSHDKQEERTKKHIFAGELFIRVKVWHCKVLVKEIGMKWHDKVTVLGSMTARSDVLHYWGCYEFICNYMQWSTLLNNI